MPFTRKLRPSHLSRTHPTLPPVSSTSTTTPTSTAHPLDLLPSIPLTPRTADPLITSFPIHHHHSSDPSPDTTSLNNGPNNDTRPSTTTATITSSSSSSSSSSASSLKTQTQTKTQTETKTPPHSITALMIPIPIPSPPLTSTLHSRHAEPSALEETYLLHLHRIRIARLVLCVISVAVCAGAVGCAGGSLRVAGGLSMGGEAEAEKWHLGGLWPVDVDWRVEGVVVGMGAVGMVVGVFYVVLAVVPSPRSRTVLLTRLFNVVAVLTLLATLVGTVVPYVLIRYVNPRNSYRDSVGTFACRMYRRAKGFDEEMAENGMLALGGGLGWPREMRGVCVGSEAGRGLMVVGLVVGVLMGGVMVWGSLVGKRVERERRGVRVGKGEVVVGA